MNGLRILIATIGTALAAAPAVAQTMNTGSVATVRPGGPLVDRVAPGGWTRRDGLGGGDWAGLASPSTDRVEDGGRRGPDPKRWRDSDDDDHRDRWRERHRRWLERRYAGFYDFGGAYLDDAFARESRYFEPSGGISWAAGNRVHYDYDRSYPYDFYKGRGERRPDVAARKSSCDMEWTEDRQGREVAVRVCRN